MAPFASGLRSSGCTGETSFLPARSSRGWPLVDLHPTLVPTSNSKHGSSDENFLKNRPSAHRTDIGYLARSHPNSPCRFLLPLLTPLPRIKHDSQKNFDSSTFRCIERTRNRSIHGYRAWGLLLGSELLRSAKCNRANRTNNHGIRAPLFWR